MSLGSVFRDIVVTAEHVRSQKTEQSGRDLQAPSRFGVPDANSAGQSSFLQRDPGWCVGFAVTLLENRSLISSP